MVVGLQDKKLPIEEITMTSLQVLERVAFVQCHVPRTYYTHTLTMNNIAWYYQVQGRKEPLPSRFQLQRAPRGWLIGRSVGWLAACSQSMNGIRKDQRCTNTRKRCFSELHLQKSPPTHKLTLIPFLNHAACWLVKGLYRELGWICQDHGCVFFGTHKKV